MTNPIERRKNKEELINLWSNFKNDDWSQKRHFSNGKTIFIRTYETGSSLFMKRGFKLDEIEGERYDSVQDANNDNHISIKTLIEVIKIFSIMDIDEINISTEKPNVVTMETKKFEVMIIPPADNEESENEETDGDDE